MDISFQSELMALLDKYDCEVIDFQYLKKAFGNIVLIIRYKGAQLNFITDRGDIYLNTKLMCNYEYIRTENKSTPKKLLEIIDSALDSM